MPPEQLDDEELQFKKRARRRLVGAIALVLLMITVLPMILDDRSIKTPQQDIAITIPSQENASFTSKVVQVAPVKPLPDTPKQPESEVAKPEIANAPSEIPPTAAIPSAAVAPASTLGSPLEPLQTPKPEVTLTVASKPPVKVTNTSAGHTAAKKKVTDKSADEPSPAVKGEFSVQIGVFSDAANVKKLQQKIVEQGYKSYTEKLATPKGDKIRLRVGPFANRSDAQTAFTKIKSAGLSGMVVSAQ